MSTAASGGPLVLGIETSCDETGVGIVRGRTLLADAVASSVDSHARFGGVVPGLAGALLVGLAAAKAYAVALDRPLYGVNHLAAHVCVDELEHGPLPQPCLALLVSGGHSSLLLVPDVVADVRPLGATVDDAAGEAFDKVARLLGLPFPGGPHN